MAVAVSRGRERSRSLSSADWIRVAMDALVEDGVAAVAVEPLAVRLGATKGSFYHHFENRDALIEATLADWERTQTEAVIERLMLIPDPSQRLRTVISAALTDRAGGERDAALAAAARHPLVRPVVERVTARRLKYMTEAFAELGLPKQQARRRATLLYLGYLGLYEYQRTGIGAALDERGLRAYADELLDALVPTVSVRNRRTE
jgi:AcrR family transcriptional regulator